MLNIEALIKLINKHIVDRSVLHYTDFICQITKLLVNEFNDHLDQFINILLVYLKLDNVRVQCNTMDVLGGLFDNDIKNEISVDLKQRTVLLIIHFLKDSNSIEVCLNLFKINSFNLINFFIFFKM